MTESIHDDVRAFYRRAAAGDDVAICGDERWGTSRYDEATLGECSTPAADLSMGCGNPYAMADLKAGESVLDLGSGAGLDVILSAKRVGPDGMAYGVDFLDEMLELARQNALDAGVHNVEFLGGMIEEVPLPDASVDVVISNCVINLTPDKAPVFAEIARVLRAGGRVAISDVVADDDSAAVVDRSTWSTCGPGALERAEYIEMLHSAGLEDVSVEFTHDTGPGLHGAIVRARRF